MVREKQTVAASNKKAVQTDAAPKALGPYSQAIVANGMVFCAGQIPLDPATGDLVAGGIAEQTHQVLKNLRAVLKANISAATRRRARRSRSRACRATFWSRSKSWPWSSR